MLTQEIDRERKRENSFMIEREREKTALWVKANKDKKIDKKIWQKDIKRKTVRNLKGRSL